MLLRRLDPSLSARNATLKSGDLCWISKGGGGISCTKGTGKFLTHMFGTGTPLLHTIDWMASEEYANPGKEGSGAAPPGKNDVFKAKSVAISSGPHILAVSYFYVTAQGSASSDPQDIAFDAVTGHLYEVEEVINHPLRMAGEGLQPGNWRPVIIDKTDDKIVAPL